MTKIILSFSLAFIISLALTPLFSFLAKKFGFLDHPNYRKIHKKDTPLLGALPIYLGFLLSLFLFANLPHWYLLIFLAGSTSILILGIIDDYFSLGATLKFLLPLISFLILISLGLKVTFLEGFSSFWFSLLWIVILANAFNFIDNMNGLATGIAFIASLFLGILAILDNQFNIALLFLALAGGSLGFLFYNFPKAKIFLGDAGSMFLGFTLASLVILGHFDVSSVVPSFFVPLIILGYPLFDMAYVVIRRIQNKRMPWLADKNHTSHCLATLLGSEKKAVLYFYFLSFILGLLALWSRKFDFQEILILIGVLIFLAILFGLRLSEVRFIKPNKRSLL